MEEELSRLREANAGKREEPESRGRGCSAEKRRGVF